MQQNRFNLARD